MSNVFHVSKKVRTYWAKVHVGLKVRSTGEILDKELVLHVCDDYCQLVGLCVSVADTMFVYTGGREPGVVIGLINYPRFPSSRRRIRTHALDLADRCMEICRQCRVSVVTPRRTYMLSDLVRIGKS